MGFMGIESFMKSMKLFVQYAKDRLMDYNCE